MESNVKTAMDVVKEIEENEEIIKSDYQGDPNTCFYSHSYCTQFIYSCQTCLKKNQELLEAGGGNSEDLSSIAVGVCYGCFVSCHSGHEMLLLNYKRLFACDCGTSKCIEPCSILCSSRPLNTLNKYTENFIGINCYCKIVHDEENEEREMVQCLTCENWFHDECVFGSNSNSFGENEFDDYICLDCFDNFEDVFGPYAKNGKIEARKVLEEGKCIKPFEFEKDEIKSKEWKGLFCGLEWKKSFCNCENCKDIYEKKDLEYIHNPDPQGFFE